MYRFLLVFFSNFVPKTHHLRYSTSKYSDLVNSDIRQKSHENCQFSHPHVFNAPAEGVPLQIVYRRKGLKKLEWWGFQKVEKVFR